MASNANNTHTAAVFDVDPCEGLLGPEATTPAPNVSASRLDSVGFGPLYRANAPRVELQSEKAWHRIAAFMVARGDTYRDISRALDKSEAQVGVVASQPFFRELVDRMIAEFGLVEEGENILKAAAASAQHTIVELLQSKSETIRQRSAFEILNRVYGKSLQRTEVRSESVNVDIQAELASLNEEIARHESKFVKPPTINV